MKRIAKGLLHLFLIAQIGSLQATQTNKTFFNPRSASVNLPMQMTTWASNTAKNKKSLGGGIQVAPFYQASTNGNDLAKYFMFDHKTTLKAGTGTDVDVHSFNFNLRSAYDGDFSFDPKVKTYGVRFDQYYKLDNILQNLYLAASTAVVHTEHDINLRETVRDKGTNHIGPNTVAEAFTGHQLSTDWSERWRYGKITGSQSLTGFADIDFKLGYHVLNKKRYQLGLEFAVLAPTGNKAKAEYVFEPLVGNGFHFGLGGGLNGRFDIWQSKNKRNHLSFWVMGDYRYLFNNTQKRTLELKGKKWGRYIRMRQQDPDDATMVLQNTIPGVNIMTRNVKVTPGSQFDGIAYLDLTLNRWQFALGYNLWAREDEKVRLREAWEKPGVFGLPSSGAFFVPADSLQTRAMPPVTVNNGQFLPREAAATAVSSATTINATATADGEFIKEEDIDLSGHPSSLTHKIFGNISYDLDKFIKHPSYLSVGSSYEFAESNKSLEQWSIWGKFGIFF